MPKVPSSQRPVAFLPAGFSRAAAESRANARQVVSAAQTSHQRVTCDRRGALLGVAALQLLALQTSTAGSQALAEEATSEVEDIAQRAIKAYSEKDLDRSYELYTQLIGLDPENPVWSERRGQVSVDAKRFEQAIKDFDAAEAVYKKKVDEDYVSIGLLSNRGLAHEGLYQWKEAIADYDQVLTCTALVKSTVQTRNAHADACNAHSVLATIMCKSLV